MTGLLWGVRRQQVLLIHEGATCTAPNVSHVHLSWPFSAGWPALASAKERLWPNAVALATDVATANSLAPSCKHSFQLSGVLSLDQIEAASHRPGKQAQKETSSTDSTVSMSEESGAPWSHDTWQQQLAQVFSSAAQAASHSSTAQRRVLQSLLIQPGTSQEQQQSTTSRSGAPRSVLLCHIQHRPSTLQARRLRQQPVLETAESGIADEPSGTERILVSEVSNSCPNMQASSAEFDNCSEMYKLVAQHEDQRRLRSHRPSD